MKVSSGAMIRAVVAAGAKAIVVQGFGWGNVNIPMYESVQVNAVPLGSWNFVISMNGDNVEESARTVNPVPNNRLFRGKNDALREGG